MPFGRFLFLPNFEVEGDARDAFVALVSQLPCGEFERMSTECNLSKDCVRFFGGLPLLRFKGVSKEFELSDSVCSSLVVLFTQTDSPG